MFFRALVASAALLTPVALAQDYSAPPMLSVDSEEEAQPVQELAEPDAQPAPQYEQPAPQQGQPVPHFGPGEYPPYTNAPVQQEGAQPSPQPGGVEVEAGVTFGGTFFESTRKKHFLALASGSVGLFEPGLMFNARAEADIGKLALLASYSGLGLGEDGFTRGFDHFTAMGGWAVFSREEVTWRFLGGLDILGTDGLVGLGPVFGTSFRAMAGSFGIDAAAFITPFPFRQVELRAALVVRWWGIFEAHAGWRFQALDATPGGSFTTLFTEARTINGPVIGVGLTF